MVCTKEEWYEEESERVAKGPAQVIKNAIKQLENETESYPIVHDIASLENGFVPQLLNMFIKKLLKSSFKQTTIAQTLFRSARLCTITQVNFGLAVSPDDCLGSKWMINLLRNLWFWASYDEVRYFTSKCFAKGNLAKIKLSNC